jgi:antitoxin HigA-1
MTAKDFPPLQPGEVLLKEFLKPIGISQNRLALNMHVALQEINEIVRGKRSITADTALRLSIALNTSPEFWLGLQNDYDLESTLDSPAQEARRKNNSTSDPTISPRNVLFRTSLIILQLYCR